MIESRNDRGIDVMSEPAQAITRLLQDWSRGDPKALERLTPLVYRELHQIAAAYMAREQQHHLLQPTALIGEAYLRLLHGQTPDWDSRGHFYSFASKVMRQVLVDYSRRRAAAKRPPGTPARFEDLMMMAPERPVHLLDLDLALQRLEDLDARKAHILEHIYFGGLGVLETAQALGLSESTVRREMRLAEAWLSRELDADRKEAR
jgi:RNA polymerase sigma factor (TIGR02999 family)